MPQTNIVEASVECSSCQLVMYLSIVYKGYKMVRGDYLVNHLCPLCGYQMELVKAKRTPNLSVPERNADIIGWDGIK